MFYFDILIQCSGYDRRNSVAPPGVRKQSVSQLAAAAAAAAAADAQHPKSIVTPSCAEQKTMTLHNNNSAALLETATPTIIEM